MFVQYHFSWIFHPRKNKQSTIYSILILNSNNLIHLSIQMTDHLGFVPFLAPSGGLPFTTASTFVTTRSPARPPVVVPIHQRPSSARPLVVVATTIAAAAEAPAAPTPKKQLALTPEAQELEELLQAKRAGQPKHKLVIAQVAPSVRIAFPEEFGKEPSQLATDLLVASLKELGFDLVLDTNLAADITICEEGTELLERVMAREKGVHEGAHAEPLPMFTSCCPGWMALVEKSAPELIPYISTCKSPHMMYGALMKKYSKELLGVDPQDIYFTSVMPCVRKRGESDRAVFAHDGVRDVDNVITTKDLGELLRRRNIDPVALAGVPFDGPFQAAGTVKMDGLGSGAGQIFGATGGVMEAAVRSVYELVTGEPLPHIELEQVRGFDGLKEAVLTLENKTTGAKYMDLRVAVINGLGNAKKIIAAMKEGEIKYDFIEVMACPGGCIAGGGQPRGSQETVQKRFDTIYQLDRSLPLRRSHDNPTVKAIYEQVIKQGFGEPKAKDLFHVEQVYGNDAIA